MEMLVEMYKSGKPIRAMQRAVGIKSDYSVRRVLRQAGFVEPPMKVVTLRAAEMRKRGFTFPQIGKLFGLAHGAIRARLLTAGLHKPFDPRLDGRIAERAAAFLKMREQGAKLREIAQEFGCSLSTVRFNLRKEKARL
jgi:hypothetical protein